MLTLAAGLQNETPSSKNMNFQHISTDVKGEENAHGPAEAAEEGRWDVELHSFELSGRVSRCGGGGNF